MAKNQLRQQMAALQVAIDFAEHGGDPRPFLREPIAGRDGGAWVRSAHTRSDPKLQGEVAALLRALVERREFAADICLEVGVKPHARSVVLTRRAPVARDLFLYRLMRLLENFELERLRACPECQRLFLKITRKEFCSKRCQARVNMRNQRRRAAERREAELNRKETQHGKATRTRRG